MKKKIFISICVLIVIVALAFLLYPKVIGRKPFANLKAEDITAVYVQLLPSEQAQAIAIPDITEVVEALNNVVIFGKDNSYMKYSGQIASYSIIMNDKEVVNVNVYHSFILIDYEGYKANSEPCEKLYQIANDLVE